MQRRHLIRFSALAGLALWVWGAPRLAGLRPVALDSTPIPGAAPFRRLDASGSATLQSPALIGLGEPAVPGFAGPLCPALFGDAPLAIAYFADFNCPNCPQMEQNLHAALGDLPLIRHELPLLGPSSELAARAALAADRLGDSRAFRAALTATNSQFHHALIARLARDNGIDPEALDPDAPAVTAHLTRAAGLASRLGLIGTPATVVGRTVVLGSLPPRSIRQMIDAERAAGPPCTGPT